ncbi:immunity 52 family protein [Rhodovulum sulfidophilum]|uniref:Imm52 family immunity protein n=1 Tax=Rhodovulum sulfidophilum TaxID=35806 RepID=UPI0019231262|nr:Imm52 family immunity protein [Rhodovulum sulfidophilum]MBL3576374.1 immunity 52 family protein [Rhodovulum sulfidophilum]MCE8433811.1 immunity 52 family protein [Rhodovulum sulfidophilum]MCF4118924.1 immunity 52 family protein [Rhodovulum sulfidophilum]
MDTELSARGQALADQMLLQDEPSEEDLAELDRLSASPNTTFLFDEPKNFLNSMIAAHQRKTVDDPEAPISLSVRTDGTYEGEIERVVYCNGRDFGSVVLQMPMHDNTDFWYQNWTVMRDIMFAVMDIWKVDWIVAQPTMYVGLQKNLFHDRRSFGWMGWTPQPLTNSASTAIARSESYRGGTFMLLQERMMNMKPPDIETCNRAEAYLLDRGALALL